MAVVIDRVNVAASASSGPTENLLYAAFRRETTMRWRAREMKSQRLLAASCAALALALATVVATGCAASDGATAPTSGYSSHGSGSGY
jgi:hypothetical protein